MDALRAYTSASPSARVPLTPAEREELLSCAVATLEHPELRAPLLSLLLHSLVVLEPHDASHAFAIRLLWQLSASNSGTQVGVSGGGGAVGVLLLGFAGASLAMLKLLERTYHASLPHCRVVSAIGVGLDAPLARRRQLEEVEAALRGCGALLVHSLSNNGYFLWQNVKQALPQLVQRVRAMVFDCGPCLPGDFSANDLREVVKGAILSSAFINEIQAVVATHGVPSQVPSLAETGASLAESIDPALRHVFDGAKGIADLSHVFDATAGADMWQTASDPAVPSLFLTSAQDEVVPAQGVLNFARLCAEQQPSRAVRVHRLRGSHVRLLMTDPVAYKQQLHLLLCEAGLDSSAAPREGDEAWQNIGALSLSDEAPLPSEGEQDEWFEGPRDEKLEKVVRRVERLANGSGAPLGTKEIERLQEGCVRCLSEPGLRRRLLGVLLLAAAQLDGASPHAEKSSRALVQLCVRLSFSLCLSPGTRVLRRVAPPPREVCVLLLGYGGASFASLRQIDAFYASRFEGCRRVIATRPGVSWGEAAEGTLLPAAAAGARAALEAQRAAVMAAVAGCERLVVHSLSNNGHVLWLELLQAYAAPLRSILRALVFEGGPALAAHMSAAHTERVVLQTIIAASSHLELPLAPTSGAGSFRENAAAFSRGAQVGLASCGANGDVAAAQAAMEPPVRTLFLTGPKDDVVPQEGVRQFAAALGRCMPSRVISVESLDGGHCRHLAADTAKYTSHLEQLFASTMNTE